MENKKETKKHSGRWEQLFENWKLFCMPARPNYEVCLNFSRVIDDTIRDRKDAKILLLGSTPEFRDLAYEFYVKYGAELTCVDISSENYEAMSEFTRYKNPKETFVHSNWFDVELHEQFDVILSDATISNIPLDSRARYYKKVASMLKDDGRFITREDILVKGLDKGMQLEMLLGDYAKKVAANKLSLVYALNIVGELCLRISAANCNGISSYTHFSNDFPRLESELTGKGDEESRIMLEMLKLLKKTYFADPNKYWVMLPEQVFEDELRQHFVIEDKLQNKTCPLGTSLPIYVLAKK